MSSQTWHRGLITLILDVLWVSSCLKSLAEWQCLVKLCSFNLEIFPKGLSGTMAARIHFLLSSLPQKNLQFALFCVPRIEVQSQLLGDSGLPAYWLEPNDILNSCVGSGFSVFVCRVVMYCTLTQLRWAMWFNEHVQFFVHNSYAGHQLVCLHVDICLQGNDGRNKIFRLFYVTGFCF